MKQPEKPFFRVALIGAVSLLAEKFAATVFLPALPPLSQTLSISRDTAQHVVPGFLLGVALSQFIWGYISDLWGRRRVLFTLLPLYILATVITARASNFPVIFWGLCMQGFGIGAVFTVSQALVGETAGKDKTARTLAWIAMMVSWSAAIGTIIGGYLVHYFDWRANFVFLGIFVLCLTPLYLVVPSYRRPSSGKTIIFVKMLKSYKHIVANKNFRKYASIVVFLNVGLFAFYAISPFLIIHDYKLDTHHYGLMMLIPIGGFTLGRFLCAHFTQHFEMDYLIQVGSLIAILGGACMLGAELVSIQNVWTIMGSMAIYLIGMGIAVPNARAGAMHAVVNLIGSGASLLSVTVNVIGSLGSSIAAHLADTILSRFMLGTGLVNLLVFMWMKKNESRVRG